MSLYAFTVLGIFLLFAPWSPVWDQAVVALLPATVGIVVRSGWARGLVSALGALDLVVALQVGRELWDSMRSRNGGHKSDPHGPGY